MVILDTVLKEIKKENLLELVRESGRNLLSGLKILQVGEMGAWGEWREKEESIHVFSSI